MSLEPLHKGAPSCGLQKTARTTSEIWKQGCVKQKKKKNNNSQQSWTKHNDLGLTGVLDWP